MKHFIRLTDYKKEEIFEIFQIADQLSLGGYQQFLSGKTVVMLFPESSIRTRVTFEKGIYLMNGQAILFPLDTLNKKEDIRDVIGYLNQWADCVIVRHKDIQLLEQMSQYAKIPVINAMTDSNHPCEVAADLYSLSKMRSDYLTAKYLFCGMSGNIGLAWKELAKVMELHLTQCCPPGYEMDGVKISHDMNEAMKDKDIICTDSLPANLVTEFASYQVTKDVVELANEGAILNPCPPFYRGEEVSADAIESSYFAGYEFKRHLLEVQQAIMIYCLSN